MPLGIVMRHLTEAAPACEQHKIIQGNWKCLHCTFVTSSIPSKDTTWHWCTLIAHINGLVQERHNSSALAMGVNLSCTNLSIWINVSNNTSMVYFYPQYTNCLGKYTFCYWLSHQSYPLLKVPTFLTCNTFSHYTEDRSSKVYVDIYIYLKYIDKFASHNLISVLPANTQLEQLEHLRSEDTPHRPVISLTIDQFILNPKSILLISSYRIPSLKMVKAEKIRKICEKI